MAEDKVTIKIETKADLKGVNETQKGLGKLSVEIKKTEQQAGSVREALKKAFKDPLAVFQGFMVGIKAGFSALKQAIQFANETIQAHLANARAVKTLEASYQALGITGTQALKNAKTFAGEMQNATGIADEVFLDAQRMLANFGAVCRNLPLYYEKAKGDESARYGISSRNEI